MTVSSQHRAFKRSKYFAKKVKLDGITFDSKREAAVYAQLKVLEKAGKISDLVVHLRYDLYVSNERIGAYESDFTFVENGVRKVVDVKGHMTPLSAWKIKHFQAQFKMPVEIWK